MSREIPSKYGPHTESAYAVFCRSLARGFLPSLSGGSQHEMRGVSQYHPGVVNMSQQVQVVNSIEHELNTIKHGSQ